MIKHKIKGGSTKKNQIIGEMAKGGFSSKKSFLEHLIEESNIRLFNNQNTLFVLLIFVNSIFKYLLKKNKLIF